MAVGDPDPELVDIYDVVQEAAAAARDRVALGVYVPDLGGVRIEDDVLVTGDGADVLTTSSRDLRIL